MNFQTIKKFQKSPLEKKFHVTKNLKNVTKRIKIQTKSTQYSQTLTFNQINIIKKYQYKK